MRCPWHICYNPWGGVPYLVHKNTYPRAGEIGHKRPNRLPFGQLFSATFQPDLVQTSKYKQSFQYNQILKDNGGLPVYQRDFPIRLSQNDHWKLIDTQTGKLAQNIDFSKSTLDHIDVELINAIGPAPLEENNVRYIKYNRRVKATEFHLVNLP